MIRGFRDQNLFERPSRLEFNLEGFPILGVGEKFTSLSVPVPYDQAFADPSCLDLPPGVSVEVVV